MCVYLSICICVCMYIYICVYMYIVYVSAAIHIVTSLCAHDYVIM